MKKWFVLEQIITKELPVNNTVEPPKRLEQQVAVLISDQGETQHLSLDKLPLGSQVNDVFYQQGDTLIPAPEEKKRRQEKAIALRKKLSQPREED